MHGEVTRLRTVTERARLRCGHAGTGRLHPLALHHVDRVAHEVLVVDVRAIPEHLHVRHYCNNNTTRAIRTKF